MAAKALITPKAITAALPDVKTRAELLKTIGVALSASNYERLDRVAHLNGIVLPGKTNTGKRGSRPALRTSPIWDRERLEGAIIGARDMREVLARLGLDRSARPRLHVAASAYGLVLPHGTGARTGKSSGEKPYSELSRRVATGSVAIALSDSSAD
jgi:hypothetical protein